MTQIAQSINTGFSSVGSMINKEVSRTSKREKKIFYGLLAMFVFLTVSYGFFVKQTVSSVVERKNIETEIKTISSNIGELELQYISRKNNLSLDYAISVGFNETNKINYISKTTENNTLTLNGKI
jgi:hypothetical protein